jgi:hypothetical protein
MRAVDAHRVANVEDLLGLGGNGACRPWTLENDIPDRKAFVQALVLSARRPRILIGKVIAGDSANQFK